MQAGALFAGHDCRSLLSASAERAIGHFFEEVVAQGPSRLAVRTHESQVTYGELNASANRMAHALLARQTGNGQPIAVLLDQGIEFIGAMLSILKSGGYLVPLDPANPVSRNGYLLQDSAAACLVTNRRNLALARDIVPPGCEILDMDALPAGLPDGDPRVYVAPDSLACVLYTSGSTGEPKGVMHDHRTLIHNALRHHRAFNITANDRQTLLYTTSVYGGLRDILNALLSGASLHTFSVKQRGVDGLAQWICSSRITILCSVATVFRQFAATLTGREQFGDLRLIKLGGEASHRRDVELYRKHFPDTCSLHCGLGSTETGVVRHFFVNHHTQLHADAVPLGYAIDDVEVLLLDEQGNPVPRGERGEIAVRSRYVCRGYWRRPELNAARFAADPRDPQVRTFRTGDLGLLRPDGCLEHRGRKDSLVKIRGNRVEVAEIESELRGVESVAHAAVVAQRDARDDLQLVAYLVVSGEAPTAAALRRALAKRLPEYMIPSTFVLLDALPQTPNGKVDRQALLVADASRPKVEHAYAAPQTPLEANLAAMWIELLGIEAVGVDDSFFELGGTSLSALRLMSRIRAQHGRILPLALLFEADTIRKLARIVARGHDQSTWSALVPIQPHGKRAPLFSVHPGGGNVLGYREFALHLDEDQPVYGIQAYGVVDGQQPHEDITEMAREYLRVMREVQPHGPYYLGGESFGGLVAYEMACRLSRAGERVALLFLGDVWPKAAPQFRRWRYLLACIAYPLTLSWRDWRGLLARKVLRRQALHTAVKRYTYADDLHRRNSLAHRRASAGYRPGPYSGPVTLFRATDRDHLTRRLEQYFGDAKMSWTGLLTGDVSIHWMPGPHREMMHGSNAKKFARLLQRCIERARIRVDETRGHGSSVDHTAGRGPALDDDHSERVSTATCRAVTADEA